MPRRKGLTEIHIQITENLANISEMTVEKFKMRSTSSIAK
jgi:hypothetical protein